MGLLAYLLVSNTSTTEKRPTHSTRRFAVCNPANCFQLLRFTAEIDGLAYEGARHADIRIIGADLVGFRTREAGNAVRI